MSLDLEGMRKRALACRFDSFPEYEVLRTDVLALLDELQRITRGESSEFFVQDAVDTHLDTRTYDLIVGERDRLQAELHRIKVDDGRHLHALQAENAKLRAVADMARYTVVAMEWEDSDLNRALAALDAKEPK